MGRPISKAMQQLVAMRVGQSEFIGATSISSLSNMLYRAARRSGCRYEFIGSITTFKIGYSKAEHAAYLIKCVLKTGGEGVSDTMAKKPVKKPAVKKPMKKPAGKKC